MSRAMQCSGLYLGRAMSVEARYTITIYGFRDCMYTVGHVFCEARPGRHGQCVGHRRRRPMLDGISQARRLSCRLRARTHLSFPAHTTPTDAGGNSNTASPAHWTRAACTTSADLMPIYVPPAQRRHTMCTASMTSLQRPPHVHTIRKHIHTH